MPLNDPYAAGVVRQPRMQILANKQPISSACSFETHQNGYYYKDMFNASFLLDLDPAFGLSWWDQENPLLLDIQASLDGGETFISQILGQVDHQTVHLEQGLIHVDGRDMTAVLIDAKVQKTYQNRTSSQVVEELAASHGMTADVTPTTTLVGRFYELDHERIGANSYTRTTTEWNLLCSLAQHEQFDIYVKGNTLYFHPPTPPDADPFVVVWDGSTPYSNATEISLDRSMTFAKDILVECRSWNSQQARGFTAQAGSTNAPISRQFRYVFPNLSQAECQAKAQTILADLSVHPGTY
jgi:hypothetical protein